MSSRLVKRQLNSLISEPEDAEPRAAAKKGVKKREARQRRLKQKQAKKEQEVTQKIEKAKVCNTQYFAATAHADPSTSSLMKQLLGIPEPHHGDSDLDDLLEDFM